MYEDKETGLSDLTTALQGLVDNLAQQERMTVNITKVTGQTFKSDKFVPSLTESPKKFSFFL
jgi:GTP cyclohydrolase I